MTDTDKHATILAQSSKGGKFTIIQFHPLAAIAADALKSASEEVYPRDPALFTVRGVENRRVLVCVGEEEGNWEHFEDGGGVSTMSVRIKLELAQRKDPTTDLTSFVVQHISKRKRVSLLPRFATNPSAYFTVTTMDSDATQNNPVHHALSSIKDPIVCMNRAQ